MDPPRRATLLPTLVVRLAAMGRRTRARKPQQRSGRGRTRWLLLGAVALALVAAGWWLTRSGTLSAGDEPARTLASYKPPDLHALVVSPTDERTVTFGHHQGMLVSRDGGASWRPLAGAGGKDAMGVALPPNSKTAYAAGHDVFLRSDDGGTTWSAVRPSLPGTDIHAFAASATRPDTFYAFVVGHGLYQSRDAGATWQQLGQAPGSTMSMAAARAADGDVLFAATMEAGVTRSTDGGRTWGPVRELAGAGTVSAVGETVYAGARNAVLVSRDAGNTWQRRAFSGNAALVAPAPSNPSVVYVLTDRLEVWRSANGGASWERAG